MRQGAGFPDKSGSWHGRSVPPGSPVHRAQQWAKRHADCSTHSITGEKGGRRGFLKGSLLYCFKLCTNRHLLPLCQEHTRWDIAEHSYSVLRHKAPAKPQTLYTSFTLMAFASFKRQSLSFPCYQRNVKNPSKHLKPLMWLSLFHLRWTSSRYHRQN